MGPGGDRAPRRWLLGGLAAVGALVGAAVLAELAGVGSADDEDVTTEPAIRVEDRTSTTDRPDVEVVRDDRELASRLLPGLDVMGAGWIELNRDPEGPNDPTLPTAPQITGECGGARAVDESGAAFVLYERRRGVDLDEQAIVYGLVFEGVADAEAQALLYRSDTLEGCIHDSLAGFYSGIGLDVVAEDRPLPELAEGVSGTGRAILATIEVGGFPYEGRLELTVLQHGRGVVLVVREVVIGAPDPFPLDRMIRDVARRLAATAE